MVLNMVRANSQCLPMVTLDGEDLRKEIRNTPDICFKPSAYLLAVSTKNLIRMCCQINEIRIEKFKTSTTGVIFEYESVAGRKYVLTVWNCFGARSTESKAIYIIDYNMIISLVLQTVSN